MLMNKNKKNIFIFITILISISIFCYISYAREMVIDENGKLIWQEDDLNNAKPLDYIGTNAIEEMGGDWGNLLRESYFNNGFLEDPNRKGVKSYEGNNLIIEDVRTVKLRDEAENDREMTPLELEATFVKGKYGDVMGGNANEKDLSGTLLEYQNGTAGKEMKIKLTMNSDGTFTGEGLNEIIKEFGLAALVNLKLKVKDDKTR